MELILAWEDLNLQIGAKLKALAAGGKEVVLLTQTFASPTTSKIVADFITAYPNVKHVTLTTAYPNQQLDAFEDSYGVRALADYDFQ